MVTAFCMGLNKDGKGATVAGNHHTLEEQVKGKHCHGRMCTLLPKAQKESVTHYMLDLPSVKDDTMSVAILRDCWTPFCLSKHACWLKTGSQRRRIGNEHSLCLPLKVISCHPAFHLNRPSWLPQCGSGSMKGNMNHQHQVNRCEQHWQWSIHSLSMFINNSNY